MVRSRCLRKSALRKVTTLCLNATPRTVAMKRSPIFHFKASNRLVVVNVSISMRDALLFSIVMIYRDVEWFIEFFSRNLIK